MKKLHVSIIAYIVVIFLSTTLAFGEMAKEGKGMIRSGKSGTLEFLKLAEKQAQVNWQEKGAIVIAPENSPFYHASFNAMGTLYVQNGNFDSIGSIVMTTLNGDKIFARIKDVKGVLGRGPSQGYVEITGGTGKCEGIEGKITLMAGPKVLSYPKGTYQKIGVGEVTWKIP